MANLDQLRAAYPNLSDDQIADLASVTLKLAGNQKTRKPFLSVLKEAEPQRSIPELDGPAQFEEALAKRDEEIKKLRDEREQEKFAEGLARQKSEAKSKFGLSEDDFTKMEEMMKKGELPADYRFAPALYRQQVEESTPTNYGTGGWGPLNLRGAAEDKNFSGFFEDPDNHALKVAHDMIDDMQRSRNRNTF